MTTHEDYPIKEYHFHVYFLQSNPSSVTKAESLRSTIQSLTLVNPNEPSHIAKPYNIPHPFIAVPLHRVNYAPIGPHTIGSYEVWVPIESFHVVYGWFVLHRGDLSILVHPLTRHEVKDHSERAVWMGEKVPLDLSKLRDELENVPAQYEQLGLGYSRKD